MVYRGLVRNGVIVLDDHLALPDGAVVTVHFTDLTPSAADPYDRSEHADRLLQIFHDSARQSLPHLDRHL